VLIQDALLTAFSYYEMPPPRPGVLAELLFHVSPTARPPRCAHPSTCDARDAKVAVLCCRGNVVTRISPSKYTLLITHHKEERQWGQRALGPIDIDFSTVSPAFLTLLDAHADWGLALLAGGNSEYVDNHFFVSPSEGRPMGANLHPRVPLVIKNELNIIKKVVSALIFADFAYSI
jgi:hypothetical protein